MTSYVQIIQRLPEESRLPMLELVEAVEQNLRDQLAVRRQDFDELKAVVSELAQTQRELAEAQQRTEQRVGELAQVQQRTEQHIGELTQAQQRTEQQIGELVQAQQRTEQQIGELTQAQQRTEQRVEELAQAQQRTEQRVEELAQAQQRTEQRVEELTQAQQRTEQRVEELAQAQQRTEQWMGELAQAQQRTEQRMGELAQAMTQTQQDVRRLARGLDETRSSLGGLSRSTAYALENEAYRLLPALLKEKYGIEVVSRLTRRQVGGEEINFFGQGRRNGQEILLVGETKLQLDERRRGRKGQKEIFEQLAAKAAAVKSEYPAAEIVPLVITHYARPAVLAQAQSLGIIVIQSFEW